MNCELRDKNEPLRAFELDSGWILICWDCDPRSMWSFFLVSAPIPRLSTSFYASCKIFDGSAMSLTKPPWSSLVWSGLKKSCVRCVVSGNLKSQTPKLENHEKVHRSFLFSSVVCNRSVPGKCCRTVRDNTRSCLAPWRRHTRRLASA
jgi:hypothetical protein